VSLSCDYIVVDWRTPELAERAINSIRENADVWRSAWLIDAARDEMSYAQACHAGVDRSAEQARRDREPAAKIVCLCNADVECRESQEPVMDLFAAHPEVAVIGPRQVDSSGHVRHAGIVGTNTRPEHRFWGDLLDEVDERCREALLDCVTVSGSVYYCRRSVWNKLGGFLLSKHYYEETWLSYLARHRGHRVCYTGTTTWLHEWLSSPVEDEWLQEAFRESQATFREACAREGIKCD